MISDQEPLGVLSDHNGMSLLMVIFDPFVIVVVAFYSFTWSQYARELNTLY